MRFDGGYGIPLKCFTRFDVLLPYIDYDVILPCFFYYEVILGHYITPYVDYDEKKVLAYL